MSYVIVRKLLETQLNAVTPAIATAFENVPFNPTVGVAFQIVSLLPGQTENPTMGPAFQREVGIFQVLFAYPINAGPQAAMARAELVRAAFARGLTLTQGIVRVLIDRSPFIGPAKQDAEFYWLPLSIPYAADVNG